MNRPRTQTSKIAFEKDAPKTAHPQCELGACFTQGGTSSIHNHHSSTTDNCIITPVGIGKEFVALLRGINVGGNRRLPMKHLAAMFTKAGCVDVETYIQTGNVVFRAPSTVAKRLPGTITAAIEQQFGFSVPVVLRSREELAAGVARNPFLKRGIDTAALHVAFLADIPNPTCVTALDATRSPGDSFILCGRDIYLWLPNGVARTKLTNNYFDRTLKTVSTIRNWNTVLKLLEMTQSR